jgi:hypothetical protein
MHETQARDYLVQQLKRNPLEEAFSVLDHRARWLQQKTTSRPTLDDHDTYLAHKEQVLKNMAALRSVFWSLKTPFLQQQLAAIDVAEYPDLSVSLQRLQAVAAQRESFLRLKQHPACFEAFYKPFCELVIAPPHQMAALQEQFLQKFHTDLPEQPTHNPRDYRRMVAVLQQEFPEIYVLEQTWLNQPARQYHTSVVTILCEISLVAVTLLLAGWIFLVIKGIFF